MTPETPALFQLALFRMAVFPPTTDYRLPATAFWLCFAQIFARRYAGYGVPVTQSPAPNWGLLLGPRCCRDEAAEARRRAKVGAPLIMSDLSESTLHDPLFSCQTIIHTSMFDVK